jgi:predicted pyridoxine 5'-phosphate oxidase superfamily flavin-nucleotide-binding protein
MARVSDAIDAGTREFIAAQQMYFVGTAPLHGEGFVNVSPKGLDTFRVLDEKTIAYLDLTGSGVETIAHVRENGRIVVMFCSFQGPPKILRLHGRGRVVEAGDPEFASLRGMFGAFEGVRSVIVVAVRRVAESCGFGVPKMRYEGEREQLQAWARSKGPEGLGKYREERNRVGLNGMPGVGVQGSP